MFVFLSYKIDSETPMFGGNESFISKKMKSIEQGDSANTSKWEFSNHLQK